MNFIFSSHFKFVKKKYSGKKKSFHSYEQAYCDQLVSSRKKYQNVGGRWRVIEMYVIAENGKILGSVTGVPASSLANKIWLVFQALGDIAFTYPYSIIVIEIQVRITIS